MTKCTELSQVFASFELLFCSFFLCLHVPETSHQYKAIVPKEYVLSSKMSDSAKPTPMKIRKQIKVKVLSAANS